MNDMAPTPPPALDRTRPLLVIEETTEDRFFVTVFGVDYFIEHRLDLDLHKLSTLEGIMRHYGHLLTQVSAGREISEADANSLDAPIEKLIRMFLPDLPEEKLHRIKPRERMALMQAFNAALSTTPAATAPEAAAPAPNRASRRSGAKSSPASSASTTRATPRSGRTSRSGTSSRT